MKYLINSFVFVILYNGFCSLCLVSVYGNFNEASFNISEKKLKNGEGFVEAMKRELTEELSWFPEKLFYLARSKDSKFDCINTYYIAHCEVPEHALVLGEGQAMEWFTIDDVMKLTNTPDMVVLMLKKAHKHINNL